MRLRLTLFLLLLNVGLFSYLAYLENREGDEIPSRFVFDPGLIERTERIAVQGPALAHPWAAEKDGNRWMVEAPVRWPANPYAVQRLLDLLRSLRWETRFSLEEITDSGRQLTDYGLGEDAATLSLRIEGQSLDIRIGAPTEVGSRLYLLAPGGQEVYVVNRNFLEGVDLSQGSLVSNEVVTIPPFETRGIFVQGGENGAVRVELAREGESWVLRAPIRVAASTEAINAALETVFQVQIGEFVDAGPQQHGLASPFLRLNLNGNNRQQTLLLGNIVDPDAVVLERYAKLEALAAIFTIPAEPFTVWETAQESLRERRFMAFEVDEASAVEVRYGERSLNLQKLESGRWQMVSTDGDGALRTVFAEATVVEDLLRRLATLEALRFATDAPSNDILENAGLRSPQRSVTVRLRNDRSLTLQLGAYVVDELGDGRTNRLYAKRENSASIYVTTASILAAAPLNELHYRERLAGTLPTGAIIEVIRVRDLVDDTVLLEARTQADGKFAPPEGTFSEEEATAIDTLAAAFRRFPVRRFIADDFTDPLALDAQTQLPWVYALEAEVKLTGAGDEERLTRVYPLTERLGGMTQFAGNARLDIVFTLPLELIDALHPVLFRRPRPDATVNPTPVDTAPPITPAPAPDPDESPDAPSPSTPES